jgi:hypothetical protein
MQLIYSDSSAFQIPFRPFPVIHIKKEKKKKKKKTPKLIHIHDPKTQSSVLPASTSVILSMASSPVLFHVIQAAKLPITFWTFERAMCHMLYFDMAHQGCMAAERLAL